MIIQTLKQQLDDAEFKLVVRALRQDAIIWEALQDIQFLKRIKTVQLTGIKPWIPANIALTHLFPNSAPRMLSALPNNLDEETKTRAAETLEALLSPIGGPDTQDDLSTAALAAIAIRERWLLLDKVEDFFFSQVAANPRLWQTTLSILYGLMPHRGKILETLLESTESEKHLLALRLVTSQPQEIERQSAAMLPALLKIPSLQRSMILHRFEEQDPTLARQISSDLLETLPEAKLIAGNPVQTLIEFMERTELLKIQGSYSQALPALDQIREMTASLQADLAAQLAQAAARGNDNKTAVEAIQKASQLGNIPHVKSQNVTLAQIHTGTLVFDQENKEDQTSQDQTDPANLLGLARIAVQEEHTAKAQNLALEAFTQTQKGMRNQSGLPTSEFLHTLIEILLAVNLVEEAVQTGQISQQYYPNNPPLIYLYSLALKRFGKLDQAVDYATIALALSSEPAPIHRELIDSLMQKGDWIEARKEAEKLISSSEDPLPGDVVLLAESYLQTGQINDAISSCEQGLITQPENCELLCMLARVHEWNHDVRAAERSLSKAIVHNPEQIEAWLKLAALHQKNNEPEKSLEKLISAGNVNPNHPAINLHIGLAHQANGDQVKALASFNQAARFIQPETEIQTRRQIRFNLGKSLFENGYTDEAISAFQTAFEDHPTDVELAHWYAQALLQVEDYQTAFPVLTVVIQSEEPSIESRLDYADLILKLDKSPEQAMEHIQSVLEHHPRHERARILLAKATAASDDHSAALELYQEAMQTELSRKPEYYTALTIGVAESAFKTEQPHVAITFLKEGLRQVPNSLDLKKKLCQAYIQANLKPDALTLFDEIQNLSAPTLQDYLWLADQAVALDELLLATHNLKLAGQIAPNNTEIIVRLGYIQLENGQIEQARETFSQLFEVKDVDITDLKLAAHALIGNSDPSTSIPFVEQALELCNYQSKDLLTELTRLQLESDQQLAALETVNKHLKIETQDAELYIIKSKILEHLGRPRAAVASIQEALQLIPSAADLHLRAARLLRTELDLTASLIHITKANQLDPHSQAIADLAVTIYRACLKDQEALQVIQQIEKQPETINWLVNKAELLLENYALENNSLADEAISKVLEIDPDHPSGLAVKSRIKARLSQTEEAVHLFNQAWENLHSDEFQPVDAFSQTSCLISLGEAAADLNKWQITMEIIEQLPEIGLTEPLPHLFIARMLTRQAERQQAYTAVKAHFNTNGKSATSAENQAKFMKAIEHLYQLTPDAGIASTILRWEQRGSYAINNQAPFTAPVLKNADDFAALAASSRRTDQPLDLTNVPEEWLNASQVKFQFSLSCSLSDPDTALQIAEELAYNYPDQPIYLAHYALLSHRNGHSTTALDCIQRALEIWRDQPEWHILAAELYAEINQYNRAIDHMEKASNLDRDNPEIFHKLGLTYIQGGLPGNGIRVLERAVSLEPLKPVYWASLAQAYQAADELNPAMTSIEKACKLAPNTPKYFLQAAEIAAKKGSLLKRDKCIRQAIEMQPKDPDDVIHLSRLLIRKKDAQKAIEILDEVIAKSTDPTPLQLQKAAIIRETSGINEEIKLLVTLAKRDPQNPMILARLSAAYIQTNNLNDAIKAGQFAITNAGKQLTPKQVAHIHYQVGTLFHRIGQLDQAVNHLTKAIQITPHLLEAYLEIAETLKDRRSYSNAVEYLEKAIRIAPNDSRAYMAAGLLHKESKNYRDAETLLKKAAELSPNDSNIKRHLASVIAMAIIHQYDTE